MGSSNLHRMLECVITDGVESESLTLDPGRNATVLAHNDIQESS